MARSTATVDLGAVAANVRAVAARAAPASVCVVVKADGYGHGAAAVAGAALEAGARWLAVAQVGEARALRMAGCEAPVILLAEPAPDEIDAVVTLGLEVVAYRAETIEALGALAVRVGAPPVPVHLKVDTGMRRVGCEPADAIALAASIDRARGLRLVGTMTHCATADEPASVTLAAQLDRFAAVLDAMTRAGLDPGLRHAANSAAAITAPEARLDLVRVGIAAYGIAPAPALEGAVELRPALSWTSAVSHVKPVEAGESVSYGHRHTFERPCLVATVPVGYADGVRRDLGLRGGAVLVRGARRPIRGVVTMDQLMVEVPRDAGVEVGDEVVLLGQQGNECVTANEWAGLLDTIGYEVTCSISPRVERRYVRS